MVHTAISSLSNTATEFLFDRDWDIIPFLRDLSLTTDRHLIRNENREGNRNVTWGKNVSNAVK